MYYFQTHQQPFKLVAQYQPLSVSQKIQMMPIITRKSVAKELCKLCADAYETNGIKACVDALNTNILCHKVKFPVLEYVAQYFYEVINENEHIQFCDKIQSLYTEGGNVILGKMLQLRLPTDYQQSLNKAVAYISLADRWYVCDIIGERVFGVALLNYPEKTIASLKDLADHKSHWVIRSIGAGVHYATKKGLAKTHVKQLFYLLLQHGNSGNKEIRQGIGWAAKTTAKFHPKIIAKFNNEISDQLLVANWFRKKVSIGLERNSYAKRNNS